MTKIYLWSRKIHRVFVLIVISLSLVMAVTGLALKYALTWFDLGLVRYLHNQLSPFFGLALFVMILTGGFMYLFPWLNRQKSNQTENK